MVPSIALRIAPAHQCRTLRCVPGMHTPVPSKRKKCSLPKRCGPPPILVDGRHEDFARGSRPQRAALATASKPRRVSKRRIVGPDRKWLKAAKQRLRLMLTVWPMYVHVVR